MTEITTQVEESEAGLMTVRETADFLRLKESTIRDWVLRRKITYIKLGGRVFVRKADAEGLINKSIVPALPDPDNLRMASAEDQGEKHA